MNLPQTAFEAMRISLYALRFSLRQGGHYTHSSDRTNSCIYRNCGIRGRMRRTYCSHRMPHSNSNRNHQRRKAMSRSDSLRQERRGCYRWNQLPYNHNDRLSQPFSICIFQSVRLSRSPLANAKSHPSWHEQHHNEGLQQYREDSFRMYCNCLHCTKPSGWSLPKRSGHRSQKECLRQRCKLPTSRSAPSQHSRAR